MKYYPPTNNKHTFNKWLACFICDFKWPKPQMVRQDGKWVCPNCLDEDGFENKAIHHGSEKNSD